MDLVSTAPRVDKPKNIDSETVSFVSGVVLGTVEVSGVVVGAEVEGAEVGAAASSDFQ
jgi:hypothetical protein